jgi:hypothetical protein
MEAPFKMEVAKLSHLHVLKMLVPFIPGVVVAAGLAASGSTQAHRIWSIEIGYKSKLALVSILVYVLGIAMIAVMESLNSLVMRAIRRPAPGQPWENRYWRRTASKYVGEALSPGPVSD